MALHWYEHKATMADNIPEKVLHKKDFFVVCANMIDFSTISASSVVIYT